MILDEAGQASEPESLIPIGLISEANGQVGLLESSSERKYKVFACCSYRCKCCRMQAAIFSYFWA